MPDSARAAWRSIDLALAVFGALSGLSVLSGAIEARLHLTRLDLGLALGGAALGALGSNILRTRASRPLLAAHRALALQGVCAMLPYLAPGPGWLAAAYVCGGALASLSIGGIYRAIAAAQLLTHGGNRRLLLSEALCALSTAGAAIAAYWLEQSGLPLWAIALTIGGSLGLAAAARGPLPQHAAHETSQASLGPVWRPALGIFLLYVAEICVASYASAWTNVFGREAAGASQGFARLAFIAGPSAGFWLTVGAVRWISSWAPADAWQRICQAGSISSAAAVLSLPLLRESSTGTALALAMMGAGTAVWVPLAVSAGGRLGPRYVAGIMGIMAVSGPVVSFANHLIFGAGGAQARAAWLVLCCFGAAVSSRVLFRKDRTAD